ncbi:hypothetical protein A3A39_00375 [Candidatus Kaiserbacteria bacterium RIFCSPLOWO2_01_FULL_54_13]|uniref:Uncharacterized protein n=1 Tax=Candidatus Kaiserbacteria bacterium RIFCSPLOWO2_01_FULL_54_13 TaxID=1798512 RepID=A0A1F6F094_9BACT|nr:MAG: hypothetical protein A3A39_00375 [Candidatus Kaiserbacteria bacterium RIFCSPLOWO2_01_FULL_54_13]
MTGPEDIRKSIEKESDEQGRELIKSPAIRYRGKVFLGPDHFAAREALERAFPELNLEKKILEKGFVTTKGRFVDRGKALEIALRENQVRDPTRLRGRYPFVLGSKDLIYSEDTEK